MDIAAFHADLPIAFHVIPRKDAAKCLFALAVLEVGRIAIVGGQHRKFPVGVYIPGVQPQFVAFAGIVIDFLKQVQVLERPGAVALHGVVLSDDVLVLVVNIDFFVVVGVFIVVGRRRVNGTGRDTPPVTAIGEAGELVESLERAYALHVLGIETLGDFGSRAKLDLTAQSTACFVH